MPLPEGVTRHESYSCNTCGKRYDTPERAARCFARGEAPTLPQGLIFTRGWYLPHQGPPYTWLDHVVTRSLTSLGHTTELHCETFKGVTPDRSQPMQFGTHHPTATMSSAAWSGNQRAADYSGPAPEQVDPSTPTYARAYAWAVEQGWEPTVWDMTTHQAVPAPEPTT